MENHQYVNQSSLETDYQTPSYIIEPARLTMGGIDLDPASSAIANERVAAGMYYTEEIDGLAQEWFGKVWLNWPFGKPENPCTDGCTKESCKKRGYHLTKRLPGNADWCNKIVSSYVEGRIEQACSLCFACTSEKWFKPLFNYPQCYLNPRTNFYRPDGSLAKGVSKGSVITYFGENVDAFAKNYGNLGGVVVPYKWYTNR